MAEKEPLYKPVNSVEVPGLVVDTINGDVVAPLKTPFRDGFLQDFSRVVVHNRKKNSSPQLVKVSPSQKRSFELDYGKKGFIFWADEYGNSYGVLQEKGGNLTNPRVVTHPNSPSGFVFWGLQESDSIGRAVRASKVMRENGIETEAIIKITEPTHLPFDGQNVTIPEFKKKLVENVISRNKRERIFDEGFYAATQKDVMSLIPKINDMSFYITTVARQVSERLHDLTYVTSEEELMKVMENVFTYVNARNRWMAKATGNDPKIFDATNIKNIKDYFADFLPKDIARNYAKLHNLGLKHEHPHLGNISLAGTICDVDSVNGEALDLGDEKVDEYEIGTELGSMLTGANAGGDQVIGIKSLLDTFGKKILDDEYLSFKFIQTFVPEYLRGRAKGEPLENKIDVLEELMYATGVSRRKYHDVDSFIGRNFKGVERERLRKVMYFSQYYHPLVVDIQKLPSFEGESKYGEQLTKEELQVFVEDLLISHAGSIEDDSIEGEKYFEFSKIPDSLLYKHLEMSATCVGQIVNSWHLEEFEELKRNYPPRAVGSMLLALCQTNAEAVRDSLWTLAGRKEADKVAKFTRINEFYELLPYGARKGIRFYEFMKDSYRSKYSTGGEISKKTAIRLFGYGIKTESLEETFNYGLEGVILHDFTEDQREALTQAIKDPKILDYLNYRGGFPKYQATLAKLSLDIKRGDFSKISEVKNAFPASFRRGINSPIQYLLSNFDKDQIEDPEVIEIVEKENEADAIYRVIQMLIETGKELHPNSHMADNIRNSNMDFEDITCILHTALDKTQGKFEAINPELLKLIMEKKYEGVINHSTAGLLVKSCLVFKNDIPDFYLKQINENPQNRLSFMRWLNVDRHPIGSHMDGNPYHMLGEYPEDPFYIYFSKGFSSLPTFMQDIMLEYSKNTKEVELLAKDLLTILFKKDGFIEDIPNRRGDSLSESLDLFSKDSKIWKMIHPDIWYTINQLDDTTIFSILKKNMPDNFKRIKLNLESGVKGVFYRPIEQCLPPFIYNRIDEKLQKRKTKETPNDDVPIDLYLEMYEDMASKIVYAGIDED